jgi:hypothetical protein
MSKKMRREVHAAVARVRPNCGKRIFISAFVSVVTIDS